MPSQQSDLLHCLVQAYLDQQGPLSMSRLRRRSRHPSTSAADIEDLRQEAVLNLLANLSRFNPARADFDGFAFVCCRTAAIRHAAREKRQRQAIANYHALFGNTASLGRSVPGGFDEGFADPRDVGAFFGCGRPYEVAALDRIALADLVHDMPPPLARLLQALIETGGHMPTAREFLGCSHSAGYRLLGELRLWLAAAGVTPSGVSHGKNIQVDG